MSKCPTCGHEDPLFNRNKEQDMLLLSDAFFSHLELNNRAYTPGGWGLDDKRPFGNSGDLTPDIMRIIGVDYDEYDKLSELDKDKAREYCNDLYLDLGNFLERKWAWFKNIHHLTD